MSAPRAMSKYSTDFSQVTVIKLSCFQREYAGVSHLCQSTDKIQELAAERGPGPTV